MVSFSILTVDWPSHVIEKRVLFLNTDKVGLVCFVNRIERTPSKGELTLLVWKFIVDLDREFTSEEELFDLFDKAKKTRFVFTTKNAFSGSNFSIKDDLAVIDTSIKPLGKKVFKLFFQSDNNIAKIVGYTFTDTDNMQRLLKDDTNDGNEFNKLVEVTEKFEKQYKRNRLVLMLSGLVFGVVLISIGIVLYCRFKTKKKKKFVK